MSAASRSPMMGKGLACLLLALACAAHAETVTGRVVGVADGDTITVLDADKVQHKIRLAGIDAPEKKQAFGNRSKESLSDLVFDKTVNVEIEKRDRYGRQIGKVSTWCRSNAAWRGSISSISASSHSMTVGCTKRQKTRPKLASGVCGAMLNLYRLEISGITSPNSKFIATYLIAYYAHPTGCYRLAHKHVDLLLVLMTTRMDHLAINAVDY